MANIEFGRIRKSLVAPVKRVSFGIEDSRRNFRRLYQLNQTGNVDQAKTLNNLLHKNLGGWYAIARMIFYK